MVLSAQTIGQGNGGWESVITDFHVRPSGHLKIFKLVDKEWDGKYAGHETFTFRTEASTTPFNTRLKIEIEQLAPLKGTQPTRGIIKSKLHENIIVPDKEIHDRTVR